MLASILPLVSEQSMHEIAKETRAKSVLSCAQLGRSYRPVNRSQKRIENIGDNARVEYTHWLDYLRSNSPGEEGSLVGIDCFIFGISEGGLSK